MVNKEYDKQICAWIDTNKDRILSNWMDLIRIPSVRGEAEPKAPYGIECARAVKAGASLFEEAGFPTRLNEDGGYALATYGEGNTTIGIFGHSDVVPVSAGWLLTEPFEPIVKDGWLVGRGASDNKSGVMIAHSLLSLFRDCDIPLKSKLLAFVGSNEESGMGDITAFVKNEQMPDLSLIPDSAFPCSLGEKGILRMWAECDQPLQTIRDFSGGDAFNTVLDQVNIVMDPNAQLAQEIADKITENDAISLNVQDDGTIQIVAKGAAMHAAYPFGSINAAVVAAKMLCDCEFMNAADKETLHSIVWMLESNYGENLGIKLEDDFGHLTVANGMTAVEDGKLRISLDIRYGTAMPGTELESRLDQACKSKGWQIVYMFNREGFSTPKDSPIPEIIIDLCQELTGTEYKTFRMAGGTYARYLKNAFAVGKDAITPEHPRIPLGLPKGHGGGHQKDEVCHIEGLYQAIRILAHTIIAYDQSL